VGNWSFEGVLHQCKGSLIVPYRDVGEDNTTQDKGARTMIFTKQMARKLKKAIPGVIEVGCFHWDGSEDLPEAAGFNRLLEDSSTVDLDDMSGPDELIGLDIPDCQGFILLDIYCYGKRGDYLMGNELVMFDSHGNIIWKSHQGTKNTNSKTGVIVARHFGVID
jgi:hypothetical protein